jgi:hypothetical protein
MRSYIVIALSLGGPGNIIYDSGDIVSEYNFPPGRAEELVIKKFLRPIELHSENVSLPDQNTDDDLNLDLDNSSEEDSNIFPDKDPSGEVDQKQAEVDKVSDDQPKQEGSEFINQIGQLLNVDQKQNKEKEPRGKRGDKSGS